jgi:hypothetical protein
VPSLKPTVGGKRLTLAAATLGAFVALLDSTAVSVALPAIRDDIGGGSRASSGSSTRTC